MQMHAILSLIFLGTSTIVLEKFIYGGSMTALGLTRKGWPKELEQDDPRKLLAYYTIRKKVARTCE